MKRQKVILDTDNTMGVYGCDIDDGLTFLYLYGHKEIELLGLTTTHGNNRLEVVYGTTYKMFQELSIDLPLLKSGRTPDQLENDAVDFLVEQVNAYPNEIVIIGLGATTNLYGAWLKDKDFFKKIKRLILMGGVHEPLLINGNACHELNFSCNALATYNVLTHAENVSLLSAQTTLQAYWSEEEEARLYALNTPLAYYLQPMISYWMDLNQEWYKEHRCFYNWDLVTAIYLTNPELFLTEQINIEVDAENLKTGYLPKTALNSAQTKTMDVPTQINDLRTFNDVFFKVISNLT